MHVKHRIHSQIHESTYSVFHTMTVGISFNFTMRSRNDPNLLVLILMEIGTSKKGPPLILARWEENTSIMSTNT